MKRAIAVIVFFGFLLSATTVFALPEPIIKIRDGMKALLTSPLEIPKHTMDEVKASKYKPLGFVGGLIKGTGHTAKKSVTGAVDVATFPVK